MQVAAWIGRIGFPLTLNAVMHKRNLHHLPETIDLAVSLGARRLEVATVQFHGWAAANKSALMPSLAQAQEASRLVEKARERLRGVLVVDYVPADHHARYPKACMGGWGSSGLNIAPDGEVLPCHAAHTIKSLSFEKVQERSLKEIWEDSPAFNAYRGLGWMQEPCRSCERREIDFGGCRCQAMAHAGDPAATDPVCSRSPLNEGLVAQANADADDSQSKFVYRAAPG